MDICFSDRVISVIIPFFITHISIYSFLNVEKPNHIQFNPLWANYNFNWKIIILILNKLGCSISETYL